MPLIIDYKVDKIIKEIQTELKNEFKEEVSYDIIVKVLEQQCKSTVKGMAEGHTIIWKYFGSYVATKKRVDALNKQYERIGKQITLEDTGLVRLSFKRNGTAVTATTIEVQRKSDLNEQGDFLKKLNNEETKKENSI